MRGFILFIVATVIGFFIDLWRAFVGTKLYAWFILTLFPALPAIGVLAMFGVILFAGVVKGTKISNDNEDIVESVVKSFFLGLLYPTILLALGVVVRALM